MDETKRHERVAASEPSVPPVPVRYDSRPCARPACAPAWRPPRRRVGRSLLGAALVIGTLALDPAAASATPEPYATNPTCTDMANATGTPSPAAVSCTTTTGMNWDISGGPNYIDPGAGGSPGGGYESLRWYPTESSINPGSFSAITGTWVEPFFPPNSMISIWPGIEGSELVQAGTASQAKGANGCGTCFWGEDYPGPAFNLTNPNPTVGPGDTITVTLTRLGAGSWQVYVSNTTATGQTYSGTWTENWTADQGGHAPEAIWAAEMGATPGCANPAWGVCSLVGSPFPCAVDWLAASATSSTGYVINAIGPLQALMKQDPNGFCSTTPPPPPPPPPTCDPNSPPVGPVVSLAPDAATGGYWMATPFGEVISCHAPFMGSPARLSAPIVAITATPHGHGYWLVASDGGVFAYGSARFFGSLPGLPASAQPHSPVVSLIPTANATGYYEVTANGDVYAFGTAPFYGSMGGVVLAKPVVGAALDASTGGYWLVASDGGIFAFHAPFYGSMGGQYLAKPVVGMSYAPSTGGYRLVASDGGVFSFDAPFHGSMGGQSLAKPVVAIATTPGGYWEVGSDGGVFCFGSAAFEGSLG